MYAQICFEGVEPLPDVDKNAVELLCKLANDKKQAAKKCSELSSLLFFALFVKVCIIVKKIL